jgi:hypothetical protein
MLFTLLRCGTWTWMQMQRVYRDCCTRRPVDAYVYEIDFEDDEFVVHKITRHRHDGRSDTKCQIEHLDRSHDIRTNSLFAHVMPPWLLITKNDEDYTEKLHPFISKGNKITKRFLNKYFGVGHWKIMNAKTFEEQLFPSEGIIIE